MDYLHDEQRREQLYRLYYYNAKRFEISNTPLKCDKCHTNLSKLDYITNFGYCDSCRQEIDEKARKFTSEQQSECLAYLRENGLIK